MHDVVFDKIFSSALEYTSQAYAEAMAMQTAVSYMRYDPSKKEKTGDIITFAQFEEDNLLSEIRNDIESGN